LNEQGLKDNGSTAGKSFVSDLVDCSRMIAPIPVSLPA
jgi:hypothetical protein